jgi:hypothetical protein
VFESASFANDWSTRIKFALEDEEVCGYIKKALIYGYKNLKIRDPEGTVSSIFDKLKGVTGSEIPSVFKRIRSEICSNINGVSTKEIWSEYYRNVEASFITKIIGKHIQGEKILEIGTGRGWISYNLIKHLPDQATITQTDLLDYREPVVKKIKNCSFTKITKEDPLPFPDGYFDTAIVIYVLHHLDSKKRLEYFLYKLNKVVRKKIIILDDTYILNNDGIKFQYKQAPLIKKFQKMSEWKKICALTFSCLYSNFVDSGGENISPPEVFLEFFDLKSKIKKICDPNIMFAEYLGIPKTKVYLNSEGLFIAQKA